MWEFFLQTVILSRFFIFDWNSLPCLVQYFLMFLQFLYPLHKGLPLRGETRKETEGHNHHHQHLMSEILLLILSSFLLVSSSLYFSITFPSWCEDEREEIEGVAGDSFFSSSLSSPLFSTSLLRVMMILTLILSLCSERNTSYFLWTGFHVFSDK